MSNRKIYRIKLTEEELATLTQVAKGKRGKLSIAVWKVQRANALLKCDESEQGPAWPDERIAEAFGTTTRSMGRRCGWSFWMKIKTKTIASSNLLFQALQVF